MGLEYSMEEVLAVSPAQRASYDEELHTRIIRFRETRPEWSAFAEGALPQHRRALYGYIGAGGAANPKFRNAQLAGDNFGFNIVVAEPGCGAPLHVHTTEEVFFALTGRWCLFWGEEGTHQSFLEPWDAVSVPAAVYRGFWNASNEPAYLLTIQGGGEAPPVAYAPTVQALIADSLRHSNGQG